MQDQEHLVFEKTKNEYLTYNNEFRNPSLETNNYLSFYPERKYVNDSDKAKEIREDIPFYEKYKEINTKNEGVFNLEEELVKKVKQWLRSSTEYSFSNKRDELYNEEYVREVLFEKKYINQVYSIVNFDLIFFVIEQLEKKMFDYVLLQQWTYKDEKNLPPLKAPLFKNGFIELLIKNDIEEKLNSLYQDKSLGYTYIAENLITFDLFLIYIILKNYPFYVLTRSRLENLFDLLKKYKSWPYPIGSIGMDIFKLLINELYLPGVTIFQEIRDQFFLDIIDPKTKEIQIKDFNRVISFDKDIYYYCDYNLEDKNDKGKKPLSNHPNLTFTFIGVYIAYILYANEEKKENDREENYLENILSLFEKKFKQNKENSTNSSANQISTSLNAEYKDGTIDISEKNIINNLCNLIDNGLNTKFEKFSSEVKILNDKFILKAKETHDTKGSKPRDLINIRRFLEPKIKYIEFTRGNEQHDFNEEMDKTFVLREENEIPIKRKEVIQNPQVTQVGAQEEVEDKDDLMDKENIIKIKEYRELLEKEKKVHIDEILNDYVSNFMELKKKYFAHLKPFKIEDYKFSVEKEKQEVIDFNKTVKIREKQLADKYSQKYIITEDLLPNFIQNIKYWKSSVNSIYHTALLKAKDNLANKAENKKENTMSLFNEREKQKEQNQQERKELEDILTQKLGFNYTLYLIPERKSINNNNIAKSLTRFISKKDFLYKTIVGDFYLSYRCTEQSDKIVSEIPLKLYLTEAKHSFELKVFKAKILEDRIERIKPIYGGVHIEGSGDIQMELLDLEESYNFTVDDRNTNIYIDIINLYDDNKEKEKINHIEKYLVTSTDDYFQIFVSGTMGDTDNRVKDSRNEDYFKRFVVNLLDFDSQTISYQAQHIRLTSRNSFTIKSNFTNNEIVNCQSLELNFNDYEPVKIATFLDIN